ncbi:MAG: XylR family transcriptional regulator [Planctomycetia bacterium]|nr:XylR family transcriptional regulator [Planctomycetia bacterium]
MFRTTRVGLLLHYTYSFYRDVLGGVRQFVETRPTWTFLPVFLERQHLRWRGKLPPDGLLASLDTPAFARAVEGWSRPIVNVGAVLHDLPYPRVAVDNRAVGRLAAQHFLERGLKNFAFLGHPRHLASEEREAAFCAAILETDCEPARSYHTRRDRPYDPSGRQWYVDWHVHRWLLELRKPVGIFVAGDIFGVALTEICRELNLRVPEDVALLGVNNDHLYCHLSRPPLSSVSVNAGRIGYEAGALLDRLLAGQEPPQEPVLVSPGRVHVRRSSEVLAIDDEDVVAAARFIREHAYLPITVTDVLDVVAVSRRSLEQRFRRALGRGLAQEIRRVRVERCKQLLAETDFKMPAVAQHSGFSSEFHLATVFRREVGMTPTDFRKQTRLGGESSDAAQAGDDVSAGTP